MHAKLDRPCAALTSRRSPHGDGLVTFLGSLTIAIFSIDKLERLADLNCRLKTEGSVLGTQKFGLAKPNGQVRVPVPNTAMGLLQFVECLNLMRLTVMCVSKKFGGFQ